MVGGGCSEVDVIDGPLEDESSLSSFLSCRMLRDKQPPNRTEMVTHDITSQVRQECTQACQGDNVIVEWERCPRTAGGSTMTSLQAWLDSPIFE